MDTDLKSFLITHSLEGVVVTDMEGNILDCNETACHLLGYRASDLDGQFVGFIFPPRSVSHLLSNLLHLARAEGGFDGDIILQDSIGESIIVRMIAQVWPAVDPSRFLLRFLDWRETHQIMNQLKESNQMASLGTLTRSLSHEILNPISVIGGYTRRLLESLPPESKEEEWSRQVMAGVEKLESMIQTVRAFLDLPPPSFEKYPLENLLKSSVDRVREDAARLGVRITRRKDRKAPSIFMDPDLLEKALLAILLNSLDRMPRGGALTIGSSHDEGWIQISFEDSGPTLDAQQIMEDLSPLHVFGAHRTHLNLAIAKRIVDDHGGFFDIIKLHSEGLRVKIRLPLDRRALAREREM